MRIIMINKYLYLKGGAEKYMFDLADTLINDGHSVVFFGTEDSKNLDKYKLFTVKNFENHLMTNPLKLIYNKESRKQLNTLIDNFNPDLIHLNNFNYQLTPSILYAIKKDHNIKLLQTVHDPQMVCPNHRLYIEEKNLNCMKCVEGSFVNCTINKCIGNSFFKSLIGTIESSHYHKKSIYKYIDMFIFPSEFMKNTILKRIDIAPERSTVLQNFSSFKKMYTANKEDYIIYFGRLSKEKGLNLLIEALPQNIKLIIVGKGVLEDEIPEINNIEYLGFKSGDSLRTLISNALFSVYPSIWYENNPLSVVESISLGTPVVASKIGGIPEIIEDGITGLLFEPNNPKDLENKINYLYNNIDVLNNMIKNCQKMRFNDIDTYKSTILKIYNDLVQEVE